MSDTINQGRLIYNWIVAQHAKGLTVYASTAMRAIKIAPKHIDRVRVSGNHCEVMRGRHWDSINYTRISAREE